MLPKDGCCLRRRLRLLLPKHRRLLLLPKYRRRLRRRRLCLLLPKHRHWLRWLLLRSSTAVWHERKPATTWSHNTSGNRLPCPQCSAKHGGSSTKR